MKILVIGGTRLLGKRLTNLFIADKKNKVYVLSRRAGIFESNAHIIQEEKEEGIQKLKDEKFDLIVDFIGYNEESVKAVVNSLNFNRYILISSCWMVKLNSSCKMNEFIYNVESSSIANLPAVTANYLKNKRQAENFLKENEEKFQFNIIRLPIFWDIDDHTGRLEFYLSRLADEYPLILINGGENSCQIGYVSDLAGVIYKTISASFIQDIQILEALPTEGYSVKDVISIMRRSINSTTSFVDIPSEALQSTFSEYLEMDPLWREQITSITDNNIYKLLGMTSAPIHEWLDEISIRMVNEGLSLSSRNDKELNFLKNYIS